MQQKGPTDLLGRVRDPCGAEAEPDRVAVALDMTLSLPRMVSSAPSSKVFGLMRQMLPVP
jgi:hypothetical protein